MSGEIKRLEAEANGYDAAGVGDFRVSLDLLERADRYTDCLTRHSLDPAGCIMHKNTATWLRDYAREKGGGDA